MMAARPEDLKFHDPVSAQSRLDRIKRVQDLQQRFLDAAKAASAAAERLESEQPAANHLLWFVLNVRNRCEIRVHKALDDMKICSYLPLEASDPVRRRGRIQPGDMRPIFRGYLFVKMVPTALAIAGLKQVRDVEGLLGHGETPTPVREQTINLVKDMVANGVFADVRFYGDGRASRIGDVVAYETEEITLRNLVVDGYVGSRKARCMANMFGGLAPVTVPLDKCSLLRKASRPMG